MTHNLPLTAEQATELIEFDAMTLAYGGPVNSIPCGAITETPEHVYACERPTHTDDFHYVIDPDGEGEMGAQWVGCALDYRGGLESDELIEGCLRCVCGCKYWEGGRCIDCGAPACRYSDELIELAERAGVEVFA